MKEEKLDIQEMESIDAAEFISFYEKHRRGNSPSALHYKVLTLQPGEGFKMTCHWKHKGHVCSGSSIARRAGKKAGFSLLTSCKEGTFRVFRFQ